MPKPDVAVGVARLRRWFDLLCTGGDWSLSLPMDARHNLRAFFFDGLFASASDNIIGTYLAFYILALGASGAQIGILSSLSGLTAAIMLLVGAFLVERIGHRKEITVWGGGGVARFMLLLLALLPLAFGGQTAVVFAIALSVTRDGFGNLAYPAWMSLIGDIVPLEGRGRYFGSRNFVMGVAGMVTILLMGGFITRLGQPLGYQLALGVAFVIGMASTYSFARIRDPRPQAVIVGAAVTQKPRLTISDFLREIGQQSGFLKLSVTAVLWNFSLNIAGPFFNVFMARELHVTPTLIAVNSTVTTVASMVAQLFVGRLADRWGPHRLQLISGLLIPGLPIAWVFITQAWQILPVNIIGGALWGVYNLASFNLLLEMTPEAQRARYSALYQNMVTIALAAGAAFGGMLITLYGYRAVFIGSGTGRFLAALLFAWLLRPSRSKSARGR